MLKDGGSYIFNVWDKIEANEFVDVIMRELAEVFPKNPPQFMQRTPHGFHRQQCHPRQSEEAPDLSA